MKPKAGDKVRVIEDIWRCVEVREYTLEEYLFTLGFFKNEDSRQAGDFTPLCECREPSPEAKRGYISNYGEYFSEYVPTFEIIQK